MTRSISRAVPLRKLLATSIALATLLGVACAPALASTMTVKDNVHLELVGSHENTLVETGKATGTVPGNVHVQFTLKGVNATSRFTIYAKGGSISGVGFGKVKSGSTGYDSFGGSLELTAGSGRFEHAKGRGGLYGRIYKLDESISAQVDGTLHYG